MSDDGAVDPYMPDYEESTMEVVIETLTGTSFEMTVSPTDTIMSIKSKIQRVEGIPVAHQHLLYRMEELQNEARLCDHGVSAGSTLRLVLSMRGGPISTRRLTTEHHFGWKDIKEYVDTTREDILDKLPPGSKVTVLLFREGEHINLIRVIENEDGTFYPFSDPWFPVKSKPRESTQTKQNDRSTENNMMMNKVGELRRKMEGLSVQKKTRKPNKTDNMNSENMPSTSGLNSEASALNVLQRGDQLPEVCDSFPSRKTFSEIYSDRLLFIQQQRNKNNIGRSHRPYRVETSLSVSPKPEEMPVSGRNCASTLQAPSIAILEEEPETSLNKKETEFSAPSPISVPSGDANTVAMSQIPSLPGTSHNLVHLAHMAHLVLDNHADRPKTSPEKHEPKTRDICNLLLNEATERCHNTGVKMGVSNRRQSIDYGRGINYNNTNLPRMQYASGSNSRLNCLDSKNYKRERNFTSESDVNEWTQTSFNSTYHRSNNNLLTSSQYASTSKLNSAHLDNLLGNRVMESSSGTTTNSKYNNEKRSPLYGRRARIERIRNSNIDSNADKYGYSNLGYMANAEQKIYNNKNRPSAITINEQKSPQCRRRNLDFFSNLDKNCDDSSSQHNILQPLKLPKCRCDSQINQNRNILTEETVSNSLPSIVVPKKSARTRCAFCNKRLNITNIHSCRCGGIFCAQHRYSEVHGCQYDYKTEGRRILEQANPLVAATKLPKI